MRKEGEKREADNERECEKQNRKMHPEIEKGQQRQQGGRGRWVWEACRDPELKSTSPFTPLTCRHHRGYHCPARVGAFTSQLSNCNALSGESLLLEG